MEFLQVPDMISSLKKEIIQSLFEMKIKKEKSGGSFPPLIFDYFPL